MNKIVSFLVMCLITLSSNAQELKSRVIVNSDKIPGSNKQVFKTLENSLNEFVSQKKWTTNLYTSNQQIECVFTITLLEQSNNDFKGSIQIQASRPVFNSTYTTPIFNYKDDYLSFKYTEFEPFYYNPNTFHSNLISVLAYYSYVILGVDADTFNEKSGDTFYYLAQNVVSLAQPSGTIGWNSNDGSKNRYLLINELLSPSFDVLRNSVYQYHINGLDKMYADVLNSKEVIANAIVSLEELYNQRPNAMLIRIFMDAKSEELISIFTDGPSVDTYNLKRVLNSISAINASKWQKIN